MRCEAGTEDLLFELDSLVPDEVSDGALVIAQRQANLHMRAAVNQFQIWGGGEAGGPRRGPPGPGGAQLPSHANVSLPSNIRLAWVVTFASLPVAFVADDFAAVGCFLLHGAIVAAPAQPKLYAV